MIQKEKLLKESQEAQLKLEKLTLQTTTNWKGIVMENQTKAILYDQFVEDMSIELANVLKKVQVEMQKWHFDQIKRHINILDVAHQRIQQLERNKRIDRKEDMVEEEARGGATRCQQLLTMRSLTYQMKMKRHPLLIS